MIVITRDEARQIVEREKSGKIFTVTYITRGSRKNPSHPRKMNCRTGVKKGVSGRGLKFDPKSHGLKSVFDVRAGGHRFVSLEQITKIKMKNKEYNVV